MTANITVSLTADDLRASTFSVCRNDDCLTGSFPVQQADGGVTNGIVIQSGPGTTPVAMAFVYILASGSIQIEYSVTQTSALHDGDRYAVTIIGPSQEVLPALARTVTYGDSAPNGEDCGPVCKFVTLDVVAPSDKS